MQYKRDDDDDVDGDGTSSCYWLF